MTPEAAVAKAWDAWWDEELHAKVDVSCCVLATRCCVKVLQALGVKAWPFPTQTGVFNAAAHELADAGIPVEVWPAHAHSVGTAYVPLSRGFPGHLWAMTERYLLDLSARQFHRPGLITVTSSYVAPNDPDDRGRFTFRDPLGQWITVVPTGNRSFVHGPDWVRNWRDLVPELLDRTVDTVARSATLRGHG